MNQTLFNIMKNTSVFELPLHHKYLKRLAIAGISNVYDLKDKINKNIFIRGLGDISLPIVADIVTSFTNGLIDEINYYGEELVATNHLKLLEIIDTISLDEASINSRKFKNNPYCKTVGDLKHYLLNNNHNYINELLKKPDLINNYCNCIKLVYSRVGKEKSELKQIYDEVNCKTYKQY